MRKMIARLLSHYHAANEAALADGLGWYDTAKNTCCDLAERYLVTTECAAGVVAALSPRNTWKQNIRLASDVLGNCYQRGAFKANLRKAMAIAYDGASPLDVLRGDKVRAFYSALMGDKGAVVVDGWMLRAVKIKAITKKLYAIIASAIRAAAAAVGISPAKFQAIVWTTIRGSAT